MASLTLGGTLRHLRELFEDGTSVGLGDGQLLARYAATRDEAAFAALVSRHGPMVIATCRAVLKHEADVEDAFQATFLVLARKARSVRFGDALGGWLHRVAYRAAVRASIEARRRRRREAEVAARTPLHVTPSAPDPDVRTMVHQEVDRLPDRERLPVVLCDLEGLTYEQAAMHLRWTEPTLRHRLIKGRNRLRERLARRGLGAVAPAVAPAVALAAERAGVPASMARAAVSAAATGTATAHAAALASAVIRGLVADRLKTVAVVLAASVGLAIGGLSAWPDRPDHPGADAAIPQAAGAMKRSAPATDSPGPSAPKPIEMIDVRGRVVDPGGRPVPGATVRGAHLTRVITPEPQATAGPDGRFVLRIPARPRGMELYPKGAPYPWVVALAPGFGIGWASVVQPDGGPADVTIRLVEDDAIEGRIMDLEGRPVVDARIKGNVIRFRREGPIAPWLDRARDRDGQPFEGLDVLPGSAIEAATGPDGRFRLTGIGRDRIAQVFVSGPRIVTTLVDIVNRDGPTIRLTDSHAGTSWESRLTLHPRRFEYVAAPSRPVEGVFHDKDTGRPIAGLVLHGRVWEKPINFWFAASGIQATTDADGRYRLTGLPIASTYRFQVTPPPGQPYPIGTFQTPAGRPSLEPVRFDVAMKRGIVIRGRLTDKRTGRPVFGSVSAYTFSDNPHIREFPGYEGTYQASATDIDDGRFEIVTLPGRGIIAAHGRNEFRRGVGAEAIRGYQVDPRQPTAGSFDTQPQELYSTRYDVLAEVDLDPAVASTTLDLQVDPGRSLTLHVVDPEGRPLGETIACGLFDLFGMFPLPQAAPTIEVRGLDPSRPRRVIVRHDGRKLIGSVYLRGDESGSRVLVLRPWAAITGRTVDAEGRPVAGLGLTDTASDGREPPADRGLLPRRESDPGFQTGPDGRFRVEGLVPGLMYGTSAWHGPVLCEIVRDVAVSSGEIRDLGDIKVRSPRSAD